MIRKVIGRLITPSHAIELLGLNTSEQRPVSELVVTEKLSFKDVRRIKKHVTRDFDANSSPFLDGHQDDEKAKSVIDPDIGEVLDQIKIPKINVLNMLEFTKRQANAAVSYYLGEILEDRKKATRLLERERED